MGGRIDQSSNPFAYPTTRHIRRHGPSGYKNYESYRDWLRDEFSFRCVFCLRREQWGLVTGSWDIDHFVPQDRYPQGRLKYENLLYICHSCNLVKSNQFIPDPCEMAFGDCVGVRQDGTIEALSEDGEILIETLRLDNEEYREFRSLFISILRSLLRSPKRSDRQTYIKLMGYPNKLPDLSQLRPPGNSKPESINASFYARRLRGELPETY
ncbi:MAG: HNH endonuclease [Candidatus Binatia bacterium]